MVEQYKVRGAYTTPKGTIVTMDIYGEDKNLSCLSCPAKTAYFDANNNGKLDEGDHKSLRTPSEKECKSKKEGGIFRTNLLNSYNSYPCGEWKDYCLEKVTKEDIKQHGALINPLFEEGKLQRMLMRGLVKPLNEGTCIIINEQRKSFSAPVVFATPIDVNTPRFREGKKFTRDELANAFVKREKIDPNRCDLVAGDFSTTIKGQDVFVRLKAYEYLGLTDYVDNSELELERFSTSLYDKPPYDKLEISYEFYYGEPKEEDKKITIHHLNLMDDPINPKKSSK